MQQEYEEAKNFRRWDKKRECYVNSKGEPVVHPREVVYNDVLAVIPLSGEYYSNVEKGKNYVKKLDKIIRDVMTTSLRQRDEERMKKNVENLVDELKKVVEEEKEEVEAGGEEDQKPAEEAVTKKQQDKKNLKKKEEVNEEKQEEADEKLEKSVEVADAGEAVAEEQQEKEVDQKKTTEKAEVSTTEVNTSTESSEVLNTTVEQCKKCMEACSAYTLKRQYEIKQQVVNSYIEEVAELKRKITDLEQDNNKLHSYHDLSYVLERIFNIKPDVNDSEKNKKGIGSKYHQVPPPFEEKITFYDDEKVEKAFNMSENVHLKSELNGFSMRKWYSNINSKRLNINKYENDQNPDEERTMGFRLKILNMNKNRAITWKNKLQSLLKKKKKRGGRVSGGAF
ncbi:myb-like protein X [Helianthus annuus]|uniref:myb-like protein X n=1 Tax=Helianthus annuus TaxID=4232 RepID=UPI000B8FE69F|nr:myb-like protein X [Helianthus annuus]